MTDTIVRYCEVEGCKRKYVAKGLCAMHRQRIKRTGKTGSAKATREQHGKAHTPEYRSWCHMKERCHNTSTKQYRDWGGRGITVCKEWQESFTQFLADMGERPTAAHSIDRIDNNGNYEPSNCKWSTMTEQAHNKRMSKNNTTGVQGVYRATGVLKYTASVHVEGKNKHLGSFATLEEAAQARQQAEAQYYQHDTG